LCATVIRYRGRGAVRDVGKAMGLPEDVTGALAAQISHWGTDGLDDTRAAELNLNLNDRRLRLTIDLAQTLIGFPRHLSQHPGGFVLTEDRLDDLVPIEPAAMVNRQVIEWDKDDIDALRFMKVDVLGLGMLGCMRRAFDLLRNHKKKDLDLATIPPEDPATYAMIRKADTLGTFQIESRAQMSMLPRLKPKTFYDIVIQVAIVRPGPIQGDMVHPYLRRREGLEKVEYPTPELRRVLEKTLGVPLQIHRRRQPFPRQDDQRDGRAQLHTRVRRTNFLPHRRLRQLWFSGEPRGQFRVDRLCLGLVEMPLPGRVLRRAAERAADGVLRAGADRA
jgi:error-prone DNA polymerase